EYIEPVNIKPSSRFFFLINYSLFYRFNSFFFKVVFVIVYNPQGYKFGFLFSNENIIIGRSTNFTVLLFYKPSHNLIKLTKNAVFDNRKIVFLLKTTLIMIVLIAISKKNLGHHQVFFLFSNLVLCWQLLCRHKQQ